MGHFFLSHTTGYFETTDDIETPDGATAVPQRPSPWHEWQNETWVHDTAGESAAVLAAERAGMKVSRLQARKAMRDAGIFAAVDAAVSASGNPDIQDAWANAIEFRRFSPTILALSAQIGLTDTQLDNLFRAAALVDL